MENITEILSSNLFKRIIEVSPVGFTIFEAESGKCILTNNSTAKIIGATLDDVYNQNFRNLESWKKSGLLTIADQALSENKEVHTTSHQMTSFGKNIWIDITFIPFEEQGNKYLMLMMQDFTDARSIEEDLRNTKDKLELAMESGHMAWWVMHLDTNTVDYSPLKAEMGGYTVEEFPKALDKILLLIHPDDYQRAMKAMYDHLHGKAETYETEYRLKKKDGGWNWFYDKGKIITRDDYGKPIAVAGAVVDISGRKENEAKLIESEEKFRSLFEESPDGIILTDEEGLVIECNPAFSEIMKAPIDVIKGTPIWRVMPLSKSTNMAEEFTKEILRTGDISKIKNPSEVMISSEDGEVKYLLHTIFPIKTPKGFRVGVILEDITNRKLTEKALHENVEELDRMNKYMVDRELKMRELKGKLKKLSNDFVDTE